MCAASRNIGATSDGRVAERFKALVLKTSRAQALAGSNPAPSARNFPASFAAFGRVPFSSRSRLATHSVDPPGVCTVSTSLSSSARDPRISPSDRTAPPGSRKMPLRRSVGAPRRRRQYQADASDRPGATAAVARGGLRAYPVVIPAARSDDRFGCLPVCFGADVALERTFGWKPHQLSSITATRHRCPAAAAGREVAVRMLMNPQPCISGRSCARSWRNSVGTKGFSRIGRPARAKKR